MNDKHQHEDGKYLKDKLQVEDFVPQQQQSLVFFSYVESKLVKLDETKNIQ